MRMNTLKIRYMWFKKALLMLMMLAITTTVLNMVSNIAYANTGMHDIEYQTEASPANKSVAGDRHVQ